MNRVLGSGLWILGGGFFSAFAGVAFGGHWGPCGPSSIWGLVFFLAALVTVPPGAIVSLIGLILHLRQWMAERPRPQSS